MEMEKTSRIVRPDDDEQRRKCANCGSDRYPLKVIRGGGFLCYDQLECEDRRRTVEMLPLTKDDEPAIARTSTKPEAKAITIELADHSELIAFLQYLVRILERGGPVRITIE